MFYIHVLEFFEEFSFFEMFYNGNRFFFIEMVKDVVSKPEQTTIVPPALKLRFQTYINGETKQRLNSFARKVNLHLGSTYRINKNNIQA